MFQSSLFVSLLLKVGGLVYLWDKIAKEYEIIFALLYILSTHCSLGHLDRLSFWSYQVWELVYYKYLNHLCSHILDHPSISWYDTSQPIMVWYILYVGLIHLSICRPDTSYPMLAWYILTYVSLIHLNLGWFCTS